MSNPKEKFESKKLPMMPIRDVVIFPYMMTPFVVGRESSVRALEEALAGDKKIFLATQHDASIDEPKPQDIYQVDPFVSVDRQGVGGLMKMAAEKGRSKKPKLKLGICGEHGGDPSSVEFCNEIGLDYVSCSPYRLPIARLAAAQAALKQ